MVMDIAIEFPREGCILMRSRWLFSKPRGEWARELVSRLGAERSVTGLVIYGGRVPSPSRRGAIEIHYDAHRDDRRDLVERIARALARSGGPQIGSNGTNGTNGHGLAPREAEGLIETPGSGLATAWGVVRYDRVGPGAPETGAPAGAFSKSMDAMERLCSEVYLSVARPMALAMEALADRQAEMKHRATRV
jgi:hypothetical protein